MESHEFESLLREDHSLDLPFFPFVDLEDLFQPYDVQRRRRKTQNHQGWENHRSNGEISWCQDGDPFAGQGDFHPQEIRMIPN
jgi:hypothetical protein